MIRGIGERYGTIEGAQAHVERPELTERLTQALDRGSVVMIADAGFGKTIALGHALSHRGGKFVWLRTARTDRDPGRLVGRLVDAVRAELPGVAEEHAERLAAAIEPLDPEAVARSLVEDLERLLLEPLVIAIDDAERLAGTPGMGIVEVLLDGSDEMVRLALCTRRGLGLRLARLKAAGRVTELGAADLTFSPAECSACMKLIRGRDPSTEEVEALLAATEGWPLGVALAAAAEPGPEELPARGRDAIFEYLAEEVFDGLDAELRERLLDASVVDELDPALEEALGLPPSFRADVEASGVFVRSLGDAYALHPLQREFLRARLLEDRADSELAELHRSVAVALAGRGHGPEAIEHWLAAGDFDAAGDAITGHGMALAGTASDTVAGWLRRLPADVRERPMLRLLAGRIAMGEGEFDAAIEHCQAAVAGLQREGAPAALLWIARLALTDARVAALDLEGAVETSAGSQDAAAEAGPPAVFCSLLHHALLVRLGADGAVHALDAALDRPSARQVLSGSLTAFRAQTIELPAGELDAALEHLNDGIAALEERDPYGRLAYTLAFKMAIHEARGELDESLEAFDDLQAAAQRTGLSGFIGAGARLSAATILILLDRPEEARAQLERVDRHWSSWVGCDQHVAGALLASREGNRARTVSEGRLALQEMNRMPPFDRVRPAAVLGPALCDAGEPAIAREALEGVLEALGPGESRARTRAALACVLGRCGEHAAAHEALAAAFDDAGTDARFFLRSEWPQMHGVLGSALEAGALDVATAVGALGAAFPGGPQVASLAEHPRPEVREAALEAAALAGRPEALAALKAGGAAYERVIRNPPALAFRTLGRFEVRRGAWVVDAAAWERKVAERVARVLLVRGGEAVPEDDLLAALWPDKPPGSARRGLQTAISSARGVLDLPWESSRLRAEERAYSLVLREGDRFDADDFESAARRALAVAGPERVPALEAASRLWAGEPLPEERYSDWAASWRERLVSLHGDVLGALVAGHREAGDHAAAARAARALVDLDPLDEHAQRLLIDAYAAAGRRGAALRQFLECRRALVEELGIEPDAETLALHRRILAG